MTWHPITEKPETVGPCEINDVFGHTHKVQWDGRNFRYAEGMSAGRVVAHYNGDQWRSLDGDETKETEMLNEHDLEDMRPDAGNCGHCHTCAPITMRNMRMILCKKCGNKRCPQANDHRNACTGSNEPGQPGSAYSAVESPLAKTYPRGED
jgi:hypothetical protein